MSFIFHLAFPVRDLDAARTFYVDGLGCVPGRESRSALILELGGHQLVAHLTRCAIAPQAGIYPRHFGLVFPELADWEALRDRARDRALTFYQEPKHRFSGQPTEHRTFFLEDPSGNLLEFKHYTRPSAIFGETQTAAVGDPKTQVSPKVGQTSG
ncbi:MAG: VOC family protein [Geitlerinemataceae cyanobacterium]